MARTATNETSEKPQKASDGQPRARELGRLRAAWSVLLGERLVPLQLQAEWVEYKLIFDDLLKRLSAQLARQAKAEKSRLEAQLPLGDQFSEPLPSAPASSKAELRRKAAAQRGLLPHSSSIAPYNGRSLPEGTT